MRNLKNGKTFEHRFRSGEEIQIERVESKSFQFLYKDGNELFFMDNETYDQVNINEDLIGEQSNFIKEGQEVQIQFHNGNPLAIVMPPNVELKIVSAPPGVKGNTATNATKQAEVETGAIVNVPMFINDGDIIRVETRTGAYIERVKN